MQAVKDKEHEKQLEVEKEAKAKQQVITYATGGGLGLVGVFLFFVMNRLKVTRKQKAIIEEQKEVVEEAHQEIKDSITYAKRIQSAILPPAKLVKEYLKENFILYKPKDVVAGDFYWMEQKENKVLFAAADCTGHGVPGAMVSVVCNNALNRSVREHGLTDPGEILTKTREIVIQEFRAGRQAGEKSEEEVKDGMDIALCSLEGNKLQYAGAHNPLWIIRPLRHSGPDPESSEKEDKIAGHARNDGFEIIETKANKQPIGKFDNPEPYTTHSFDLEPGDSLYIFSDGYVDQFGGEKGKKFKSKAFRSLLLSIQDKSMEEQKTIIDEAFETWKGSLEQIDDVCVIGVRV
jgi:serine phosphatase RsbU (regulator of sigma subunit)